MILQLLLCPIFLITGCLSIIPTSDDFTHSQELLENEIVVVFWKYDDTTITFEVHTKTLGWVGFGISPNGKMAGSDIIIAWVKDGETFFSDRHADREAEPIKDAIQDWTLLLAQESGNYTIVQMSRRLITGDLNDFCITLDTVRLIYAFHEEDPADDMSPLIQHQTRGTKSIQLLSPQTETTELPDSAFSIDFINSNGRPLGNDDTTYWCQTFKAPDLNNTKHHIIKMEPIIQPGHETLVHHILLYGCYFELDEPVEEVEGRQGHCYIDQSLRELRHCDTVVLGWAIGEDGFQFPDNVGFAIGHEPLPKIYRMETHYDNPEFVQNIVDRSGLRIWVTTELREHDVGLLQTGMEVNQYSHLIPPKANAFLNQGVCHGECLSEALEAGNQSEINVFAVLLHSHLAGRGLRLQHIRNGMELPPIITDNNYDFDFQEYRTLRNNVVVKPGDHLITQCVYETTKRNEITQGGPGTRDEMCLSYIYYYPQIPIANCYSNPTYERLAQYQDEEIQCVQYQGICIPTIVDSVTSEIKSLESVLLDTEWNDATIGRLQEVNLKGNIRLVCESFSGLSYQPDNAIVDVPEIEVAHKNPLSSEMCHDAFKFLTTDDNEATKIKYSLTLFATVSAAVLIII